MLCFFFFFNTSDEPFPYSQFYPNNVPTSPTTTTPQPTSPA